MRKNRQRKRGRRGTPTKGEEAGVVAAAPPQQEWEKIKL
jgi:hypothetical protein